MRSAARPSPTDSDLGLAAVVEREQSRLRRFIRRRVADRRDAEDILQDVFQQLVEANRLLMPIEHLGGWLFQVARSRIADFFRKRRPEQEAADLAPAAADGDEEGLLLEDLLTSAEAGPEALYHRGVLLEAIELALDELPPEQREVFVAHEIEGRSFKEMAASSGHSINTLLSRKRYAVLRLRELLQKVHDDFAT